MGDTQVLVTDSDDPNEWGGNAGAIRIRRDGSAAEFTYNPEALHAHPWQPFPGGGGQFEILPWVQTYTAPDPLRAAAEHVLPASPDGTALAEWDELALVVDIPALPGTAHVYETFNIAIPALTATHQARLARRTTNAPQGGDTLNINYIPSTRTLRATIQRGGSNYTQGNHQFAYIAVRRF